MQAMIRIPNSWWQPILKPHELVLKSKLSMLWIVTYILPDGPKNSAIIESSATLWYPSNKKINNSLGIASEQNNYKVFLFCKVEFFGSYQILNQKFLKTLTSNTQGGIETNTISSIGFLIRYKYKNRLTGISIYRV